MMFYRGTYRIEGSTFKAQVEVGPHSHLPETPSVLGVKNARLELTGTIDGDSSRMTGTTPQAPGISFQAQMTRIAN